MRALSDEMAGPNVVAEKLTRIRDPHVAPLTWSITGGPD